MKKSLSVCLVTVVFISWAGIGCSQQGLKSKGPQTSKVHPGVWKKVKEKGSVSVIVELDIPWKLDSKLSKEEMAAQDKALGDLQRRLLAELAGTNYNVRGKSPFSPLISLDVDADALAILENSPLVLRVNESAVLFPALSRTVPFVGAGPGATSSFGKSGRA